MDMQPCSNKYRYCKTCLGGLDFFSKFADGDVQCPPAESLLLCEMGLFFEKARISLKQWIVLMYWCTRQYPVTDAAQEAEVKEKTAIQAYQYCRDIRITKSVDARESRSGGRNGCFGTNPK